MSNGNIGLIPESYTLAEVFISSVNKFPQYNALWVNNKIYTYQELYLLASHLAVIITKDKSQYCAILCGRNITAYTAIIGASLANKTYMPLNKELSSDRLLKMWGNAASSILIVDNESIPMSQILLRETSISQLVILPEQTSLPDWTKEFSEKHRFILPNCEHEVTKGNESHKSNEDAYLLFTSGSTGMPKGVAVPHKSVVHYLNTILTRYTPNENDRFSQVIDLTFDLSMHDMWVCWSVGACLYCFADWNYLSLVRFIKKHKLTFWLSVPSTALMLLRVCKQENQFPSLKVSLFCGEPLSQKLANSWQTVAKNSIIENLYGPTEATIAFTAYKWNADEYHDEKQNEIISIGKAFNGLKTIIIDDDLKVLPSGKVGELCLAGVQVVTGYLNDTVLTNKKFIVIPDQNNKDQVWYRTGDLALEQDDGNIMYKGRCDDQLQVRGMRVEKLEIEITLQKISNANMVAIIPNYASDHGVILGLTAFVCQSPFTIKEIMERCRREMPHYLIPNKIIQLESLPLNSRGKKDYKKLEEINKDSIC